MYNPLPQCTKTDKLLGLLEAAHRVDRRRLHEHDEDDEEDVGDRRRDGPVGDVVPEACAGTVDGVATAVAARHQTLKWHPRGDAPTPFVMLSVLSLPPSMKPRMTRLAIA